MKKIIYLLFLSVSMLLISSCQKSNQRNFDIPVMDVRNAIQQNASSISLDDDIKSIEYIPLETTDSCLISNILDMRISKDFIFIYNGKTSEILQFNRKGKFIRKMGREGNGPGEYNMITELSVDETEKKLFIFQYGGPVLTYSFDGNYLYSDTTIVNAGGMHILSNGMRVLKGLTMNPVQNAPWAGALASSKGELLTNKSLYSPSSNKDVLYMKEICFSPFKDEVLLFTSCNDTIFRINSLNIQPRFVLNRSNETSYYNAVADITKRNDPILDNSNTIEVYDMFETYHSLYIRIYKGENTYIQRYNKDNARLESYCVPETFMECSEAIPGNNVMGIESNIACGIPFWPEFSAPNGTRAQIVSSFAISELKRKGYLHNLPMETNIQENDNPLIIIYTFEE
ncbi:MAG: 6-bladed beta-propeller [Bacteroides sp.]|nr:6-bladed beta-propeller [Bacteroides sp.]